MAKPPPLSFSHIGIFVHDLPKMQDFYTRVLGFPITDRGDLNGRKLIFMSRDPIEHHQIVLCEGRPADLGFNVVNQISLRARTLDDLRTLYAALEAEKAAELVSITHGIAWSVYCHDPEGNRIELFVDSPWYVDQPHREPIDLMRPDAEILAETEARIKDDPSFRPLAEWRRAFKETMLD
jgi:catechol-2,3-dioxygenase